MCSILINPYVVMSENMLFMLENNNYVPLFLMAQWLWEFPILFPGLCILLIVPIPYLNLWHPLELQCHLSRHFFVLLLLCLMCSAQDVRLFESVSPTRSSLDHFLILSLTHVPMDSWLLADYIFYIMASV